MARNFVDDALSDLIFENVNNVADDKNVKTIDEPIVSESINKKNVNVIKNVNNVETFTRVGKDAIVGYENEPEVSLCINISTEAKIFITTEAKRRGMKIKEFVTELIVKDNENNPLSRAESFEICKKCKMEDKKVSRYTIPQSVEKMFVDNAKKNYMNKTEYFYYLTYKIL